MKFSVVVPTFNRPETLRQTLNALRQQDYEDYEVIVVDDGSREEVGLMVKGEFPEVRYLYQENKGPGAARNRGWRAAAGEIVAFTDDDCAPPKSWLSRMADGYHRYPQAVGVGGYQEASEEVLSANAIARYEAYIWRTHWPDYQNEYLGGEECPAGATNSMSYKRAVLEEVGGFSEELREASFEDSMLKWKVTDLGYKLLYIPVKVVHLRAYTWDDFRKQQQSYARGAIRMNDYYHVPVSHRAMVFRLFKRIRKIKRIFKIDPSLLYVKIAGACYVMLAEWKETHRIALDKDRKQTRN